jgi:hypothetical protein
MPVRPAIQIRACASYGNTRPSTGSISSCGRARCWDRRPEWRRQEHADAHPRRAEAAGGSSASPAAAEPPMRRRPSRWCIRSPQLFPNLERGREPDGRARGRRLRPRLGRLTGADGLPRHLHLARRPLQARSPAQQRTEIAGRSLATCRVFLFDEPNSALTDEEGSSQLLPARCAAWPRPGAS